MYKEVHHNKGNRNEQLPLRLPPHQRNRQGKRNNSNSNTQKYTTTKCQQQQQTPHQNKSTNQKTIQKYTTTKEIERNNYHSVWPPINAIIDRAKGIIQIQTHTKIHNNKMPARAANTTAKQKYQPKDDTKAQHKKGNQKNNRSSVPDQRNRQSAATPPCKQTLHALQTFQKSNDAKRINKSPRGIIIGL